MTGPEHFAEGERLLAESVDHSDLAHAAVRAAQARAHFAAAAVPGWVHEPGFDLVFARRVAAITPPMNVSNRLSLLTTLVNEARGLVEQHDGA